MEYRCEYCGFSSDPSLKTRPGRASTSGESGPECPVCLDGQADPWQIIREIRALLSLNGPAAAATRLERATPVDRFADEWPLLQASVRAIWADLTDEELASVGGDRSALESLLQSKYGYGDELAHQLCTGVEELHERFNGQWEVVRECVPDFWTKLNPADVATMAGTMTELAGLVARRYGLERKEARTQVNEFLEKIDYRMLVRLFGSGEPTAGAARAIGEGSKAEPQQAVS